jgi:hypothetical protein
MAQRRRARTRRPPRTQGHRAGTLPRVHPAGHPRGHELEHRERRQRRRAGAAGRRLSAASSGDDAARDEALSRWLGNRALAYRQLFDPVVGFFRGRDADGRTAGGRFDPRVWGGDYVETNAWGCR